MVQINQDNLHLLMPGKIFWLVEYLHDDFGFSLQECLNRIYHSLLYKIAKNETPDCSSVQSGVSSYFF